jgi:hypothetical protein
MAPAWGVALSSFMVVDCKNGNRQSGQWTRAAVTLKSRGQCDEGMEIQHPEY